MAVIDRRGVDVDATDIPSTVSSGMAIKSPARAATTGSNITLAGLQTIDGVALAAADRVLVKDQIDQTTNGLYSVSTGNWTRVVDLVSNTQIESGMLVVVREGTVNAATLWMLTTPDPITIGTSNINFLGRGFRSKRTITTNGDIMLLATEDVVILSPTVPAARTVNLPANPLNPVITIIDGNGSWDSAPVTFAAPGTINGLATGGWQGTSKYGANDFRSLSINDYQAGSIG